ncbi:MAG: hypothetical protein EP350_02485 [Alphaproteobacteria bacterium]|nr:MAG: hypothetical protein EP350_02485 [Alphaproteobacteria bacterium]
MYQILLSSALALWMIGPLAETANDKAAAPGITEPAPEVINIDEDFHERLTVPVTIDGVGPFNFMIDTGSQATVVTDRVHSQVALPSAGTAIIVGMASRREVGMVEVESLGLGTRTIYDFNAPLLLRDHVGADGILGLDSLQDMRVLIDFRTETMSVVDAPEKASRRGYEIVVRAKSKHGQLLITNALVDGVRTTVIVDTGSQGSVANLALREKIRQRRAREVKAMDVNGAALIAPMSYARTLEIQGMQFTNVAITYADTPAFKELGFTNQPVLSLGMQSLRLFDRVAIDFSNRQILFDLPHGMQNVWPAGGYATRL